jgi:hypothetical protein
MRDIQIGSTFVTMHFNLMRDPGESLEDDPIYKCTIGSTSLEIGALAPTCFNTFPHVQ